MSSNCTLDKLTRNNTLSRKSVDNTTLSDFIFKVIGQISLPFCPLNLTSEIQMSSGNKNWKMWLTGFMSVTIINACAALGFIFKPLMNKPSYKVVIAFMIAMAVGSLSGSALLILIPDSFKLSELQNAIPGDHIDYKFMATVIFGGVYMFFLVEHFLKWIINRQGYILSKEKEHHHGSMNIHRPRKVSLQINNELPHCDEVEALTFNDYSTVNGVILNEKNGSIPLTNSAVVVIVDKKRHVAPVAWMIVFGDALHNFIDGLSIGAAFSLSIFKGISLSLAVMCEELPHELGDFAILINAGMTLKQALKWNLISAATCYLGFIVGILLGEMTSSSTFVFAVAGGMFLYISLVDMMPELNAILEDSVNVPNGRLKIFIIQNFGLLFGYVIILIMACYGDRINIPST